MIGAEKRGDKLELGFMLARAVVSSPLFAGIEPMLETARSAAEEFQRLSIETRARARSRRDLIAASERLHMDATDLLLQVRDLDLLIAGAFAVRKAS